MFRFLFAIRFLVLFLPNLLNYLLLYLNNLTVFGFYFAL